MKKQILFFRAVLGILFVSATHILAAYNNEISVDNNAPREIPITGGINDDDLSVPSLPRSQPSCKAICSLFISK
jgi:hypothetical protein